MLNNKLISIIIPIYNERKNLSKLITVIEQELKDRLFELIFIDDNSTDSSYKFLKALNKKNIRVYKKVGKKGKAYSLVEGFAQANGFYLVMIDGDLQYSPHEIIPMIHKLDSSDIVVADRKIYTERGIRKIMSRTFKNVFGSLLFNLQHDIQAGLKVFKKSVWDVIAFTPKSPWAFDLEFLHRSNHAGYHIKNHAIAFIPRNNGLSKVSFIKNSFEIATQALKLRLKNILPVQLYSENKTAEGVGIGYKRKQYITHTKLPYELLALQTFTFKQKLFIVILFSIIIIFLVTNLLITAQILIGILSAIYFIDALFNLLLMLQSVRKDVEVMIPHEDINALKDNQLPLYTILCPLYKESHVIPSFLEAIEKLDYPKNKLEVLLLLEEDDTESVNAVSQLNLPSYVRSIVVPDSQPKTKPKACNYGLTKAHGEYLVIYDAEDIPDPLQLKKSVLAFKKLSRNIICLQAKLNYYNPEQNLLTRFFTAEYSLWFDVILPGLQTFNTTIPLGGTSNHFRTADLQNLLGWDPFNVTEDADLGIRLFRKGYRTAIIDSTTYEEANSSWKNWIRQRSRWIKGYMQTYLVHIRQSLHFKGQHPIHALIFQLILGGKIAFILINPLLWVITILYFVAYRYVGPTIETLYIAPVFYMAVMSLVFGNFMYLFFYMIGLAKREQWSLIKYIYLVPIYWLVISYAGAIALYQLILKPHYWEKTIHGLHLKQKKIMKKESVIPLVAQSSPSRKFIFPRIPRFKFNTPSLRFPTTDNLLIKGVFLVFAGLLANSINLFYSIYLGRVLDLDTFSIIILLSSFYAFTLIPFAALTASVNSKVGYLEERYSARSAFQFFRSVNRKSILFAVSTVIIWIGITPLLQRFFHLESIVPLLMFTPVWFFGFFHAINKGYLSGKLLFTGLSILIIIEPLIKLVTTFVFLENDLTLWLYATIPLSVLVSFFIGWILTKRLHFKSDNTFKDHSVTSFPKEFYLASLLSGMAIVTYLNIDLLLVRHYFSAFDAGRYALISLVGKIIFFLGGFATQFIIPLVSRNNGARKSSQNLFSTILFITFLLTFFGYLVFGFFGGVTMPLLFNEKAFAIIPYVPLYSFAIMCFSLSSVFISYYLAKKSYSFAIAAFIFGLSEILVINYRHDSLSMVVWMVTMIGALQLVFMVLLHLHTKVLTHIEKNIYELVTIFTKGNAFVELDKPHILILNWRDINHVWAGGAELYTHELAKRFVQEGNRVTVFTAWDHKSSTNQIVDGVNIIRRGGFYTVYVWAFIYYLLKFRKDVDIIIDCENGIPFFTPLYIKKPIYLLIHHVHQDVFAKHLVFPLSLLAKFLEAKIMPAVYKNNEVITVSDSSKSEILKLGFVNEEKIHIVHPGIADNSFFTSKKTLYPSFIYLGRLKKYKKIDTAIISFAEVVKTYPKARFFIVGEGEAINDLMKLSQKYNITNNIEFFGKVTEIEKITLLAKSWVMIQPSEVEGWGITVVEANACGTPVIATNVNGLKDSVVHNYTGILVKPNSISALTHTMILLIKKSKLRKTLSENAYQWAKKFHWNISAASFLQIIRASAPSTKSSSLPLLSSTHVVKEHK